MASKKSLTRTPHYAEIRRVNQWQPSHENPRRVMTGSRLEHDFFLHWGFYDEVLVFVAQPKPISSHSRCHYRGSEWHA